MPTRPTLAYQPALDGVRALAVAAVLLFHGGVPGFDGGYLGVSVFFTLSGYLITSLLLAEHARSGRIDLAEFYSRRLRRLLPASGVCLLAIALAAALTDWFDAVESLRAHVLGSLFQVANWVFLAGEGSYQDLLARSSGTVSPLEHFWSLAIEEQFYWVWPPTVAFLLRRVVDTGALVRWVGAITAVALVAAPVIARVWGPDAAYWATPARIGEILVGALLAVVLTGRRVPGWWHVFAPVALAALAVAVVTFPAAGGPAYAGALPLVALVSGALLLGLQAPGPVRTALSVAPLVWLGRVSYGVYVFHWPIYTVLDAGRTGLDGPALLALRLAVTLAVTEVSYRFLETPVRRSARATSPVTFGASFATSAALAIGALAVVPTGLGEYWETDAETARAAAIEVGAAREPLVATATPASGPAAPDAAAPAPNDPASSVPESSVPESSDPESTDPESSDPQPTDPATDTLDPAGPTTEPGVGTSAPVATATPTTVADTLPPLARPVRIVVTGDSTANAIGSGVVGWAAAHPDLAQAEVVGAAGCGFLEGGERRVGDTIAAPEGCDGWVDAILYPEIERLAPDVVMVMVTSWDLVDRRWDTDELIAPTHPDYAARLAHDYGALVDGLLAAGAGHVVFVRHPIPDVWWLPAVDAQEDPARHAVVYATYARLADGDRVSVVALDRWFADAGIDRDQDVRPDGIHVAPEAAIEIVDEFLGERLVRAALGAPIN